MTREASSIVDDVEQDRLVAMMQKLRMQESGGRARVLLQDMAVLRAWQQSKGKRGASNAERDTMLKVGTRWSVQGKLGGAKSGRPRTWRKIWRTA